jgi:hypothetical protein
MEEKISHPGMGEAFEVVKNNISIGFPHLG